MGPMAQPKRRHAKFGALPIYAMDIMDTGQGFSPIQPEIFAFFCGFPMISDKIPMSSNVAGKSPKIPELNDYSSKNHLEMGGIWYHPT